MKVSVLMVSYNEKEFIDASIQSVLAQKGIEDYEIIIGDDGSSDGTIEKIQAWQERYPDKIQYFVMDRPKDLNTKEIIASMRVTAIKRRTISMAKGDYICSMAGDDFYCSDIFLKRHVEMLEKAENSGCIACFCGFEKYWSDDERVVQKDYNAAKKIIKASDYLGQNMYAHVSTFMYRNIFRGNTAPLDHWNSLDDEAMVMMLGTYGNFCVLPEVMFSYRQRKNSVMDKNNENDLRLSLMLTFTAMHKYKNIKSKQAFYSKMYISSNKLFKNRELLTDSKYDKYFKLVSDKKWFDKWVKRGKKGTVEELMYRIRNRLIFFFCYVPYRIAKRAKK